MIFKRHLIFTLCTIYGILLKGVTGVSGQYPLVQNMTVTQGGTVNMTCRVEYNDNTSLQWSNPAQQTLFFGDKKALRDNRIELVQATTAELTISLSDVTLADEGMYTCSLFTMPVRTAKAFLTVLGVPEKPEIDGFIKPALEGDKITLTCITQGSKPAADLRWFRNEKEIKGAKEVNASGKTFTVRSSLQLEVNRDDDGVAYTCKVDHVALSHAPQQATEVLEVHYAPHVEIISSLSIPQETQFLKLECMSKGNPSPDPVTWFKDGAELPDLERILVEGRELTISSLNKTDNGTYRCEARNHLGVSKDEYVLYVYDAPTTPPPPTTSPPPPTPPVSSALRPHASDPTVTDTDPNALGQHGTDHALIGGVVAVVVFVTLCLIIVLGRYLARHKGTYLTNEAKGADDAPDADTAIINAEGNHAHTEEKKEYFI
ncbi:cell adhesion molecule 2a isoform X1 [Gadus morhua]|uniref:Ig-like domain-containing protein n=2 Tax=Gadus morhua TaxID=8049 RepID=A0A8C5FCS2_GADMO|nr:cell adhesion molecule 2-like isoform X1 [Gadus morhua]